MIRDLLSYQKAFAVLRRARHLSMGLYETARLGLSGKFVRIPMDIVTDQFAFSYADSGWNFFRELVAGYEENSNTSMQESTFYHFFKHEQIQSVRYLNELLFFHDPDFQGRMGGNLHNFYFGTYPWGEWSKHDESRGGFPWGHHYDRVESKMTRDLDGYRRNPFYRPGDDHPLAIEWDHTTRLYRSLKHGYWPALYSAYPEVVLLIRRNTERRAVVYEGQHRIAILSQLGYKHLSVIIPNDSMRIIREDDAERWFYVRKGLCSLEQALHIFNAFFELNGRERAKYMKLPTAY